MRDAAGLAPVCEGGVGVARPGTRESLVDRADQIGNGTRRCLIVRDMRNNDLRNEPPKRVARLEHDQTSRIGVILTFRIRCMTIGTIVNMNVRNHGSLFPLIPRLLLALDDRRLTWRVMWPLAVRFLRHNLRTITEPAISIQISLPASGGLRRADDGRPAIVTDEMTARRARQSAPVTVAVAEVGHTVGIATTIRTCAMAGSALRHEPAPATRSVCLVHARGCRQVQPGT